MNRWTLAGQQHPKATVPTSHDTMSHDTPPGCRNSQTEVCQCPSVRSSLGKPEHDGQHDWMRCDLNARSRDKTRLDQAICHAMAVGVDSHDVELVTAAFGDLMVVCVWRLTQMNWVG
jgi:hypothetical protein